VAALLLVGTAVEAASPIAVTLDDLPVGPPGRHTTEQQADITRRLVASLAERRVPAIGFVNEAKLEVDGGVDPRRVALLEAWLEGGLELGNHGYAHLDLHEVDVERWLADVVRGERVTRGLVAARGGSLGWFRHPFLHAGRSREVQARVEAFLRQRGYRIAPVTIDNGEWLYADLYADAWNRGERRRMRRLGRGYVGYMLDVAAYYERQSRAILGRPIPHVLLLHANALNADWLGTLLDRLAARGHAWVPLAEAVADPAYARPIDGYLGPGGITWLHRWAITEGLPSSLFAGEPKVPRWVRKGVS
jgi:peptidoglycan/xylan/chitin deacetylase (PgdA/CDA1 family)